MLTVDRKQPHALLAHGPHDQLAADHERLFVRQGDVLAGEDGPVCGHQAGKSDKRAQDGLCLGMGGNLYESVVARHDHRLAVRERPDDPRVFFTLDRDGEGVVARDLLAQQIDIAACAQADDTKTVRMVPDHLERAAADGACGAKNDDVFLAHGKTIVTFHSTQNEPVAQPAPKMPAT